MERMPAREQSKERDKEIFAEAISSTRIESIPTNFDGEAVQRLTDRLADSKLFLLGEMHGVKENADVIYTLFTKFNFAQLALEWEPELHAVVLKFHETGELHFDWSKDSPDGRITAAHFALISKLKSEGLLEKLICFNERTLSSDWDVRDAAMAQHILKNVSASPTLVVAGNLHAMTRPITFNDGNGDKDEEHHPMGENIKNVIPNVPFGKIEYNSGHYYNFGVQQFKRPQNHTAHEARFYLDGDTFVYQLPNATAATVPDPHTRLKTPTT